LWSPPPVILLLAQRIGHDDFEEGKADWPFTRSFTCHDISGSTLRILNAARCAVSNDEQNKTPPRKPSDYDKGTGDRVEKKPPPSRKQSPQQDHNDEDHG
jgi:hypothetical protein